MTEEQVKKEEDRAEKIAEMRARYKKFDFAEYVSREKDDEEIKQRDNL